jgi:4-nitrophenyl phosphatase
MLLPRYKTILLDGDGVLWKANDPLPGLNAFFDFLHDQGIGWALLTNNNSRTAQAYVEKLARFGIAAGISSIFTSCTVTAEYLLDRFGPAARLHVVGMDGLITTLTEAGFKFTVGEQVPKGPVDAVVAGMDLQINHEKIKIAMRLILGGAAFIATNTDGSYPTPEGVNPGTGMVIGALQATSGVMPYVAGKPHPAIFQSALKRLGSDPGEALMVGDRLETDILGANLMGIPSAAVLTGVTSREEISRKDIKPGYIFEDIAAVHQALQESYH